MAILGMMLKTDRYDIDWFHGCAFKTPHLLQMLEREDNGFNKPWYLQNFLERNVA
jgi:hypothetical protein